MDVAWRVERIGNTSLATLSEMRRATTGEPLLRAEIIYVNFDSEAVAARRVPDDMRRLVETYEATGVVIPLSELPELGGLKAV